MKCSAQTPTGEACFAEAQRDSIYCVMHDDRPEARARHLDMSRRGGIASRAPLKPVGVSFDVSTPEAILSTLDGVGKALAEGRCDRGTANALGILAKNASEVHRIIAFGQRLKAIERRLGINQSPLSDDEDTEAEHGTN